MASTKRRNEIICLALGDMLRNFYNYEQEDIEEIIKGKGHVGEHDDRLVEILADECCKADNDKKETIMEQRYENRHLWNEP
jgi:hypothetical protein